jgi:hypothetical protein
LTLVQVLGREAWVLRPEGRQIRAAATALRTAGGRMTKSNAAIDSPSAVPPSLPAMAKLKIGQAEAP